MSSRKRFQMTDERLQLFKKLYEEGYSGSLIWQKVRDDIPRHQLDVQTWLAKNRKKLGLAKRGTGYRPKYSQYPAPDPLKQLQAEIDRLQGVIDRQHKKQQQRKQRLIMLEQRLIQKSQEALD